MSYVNRSFRQVQLKIFMFYHKFLERFVRVQHAIIKSSSNYLHQIESCLDYLFRTDLYSGEFPRYQHSIDPKLSFLLLLILSLFLPVTLTNKYSPLNHFDFLLANNSSWNLSRKSQWHAGCCIRFNRTMCDTNNSPSSFYSSNTSGSLLFDGITEILDRHRTFSSDVSIPAHEFLQNQTLFCQRFDTYRSLSTTHLAIFTYCIVIIGILFNSCVFLVLIFGSMRRSTSFTLFLALTCFDLLSLASSLFASLFRTVMPYLKTSPPFCKMFGVFFLYFRQCSSTTLLLIAIERCIVIKYPFCRHIFNRFRLPFLATIMFLYVVPIPFDFLFYTSGSLHCEAFDTPHAHRYQIFRGFFTVFSYAMIPFVGISISNLLIIIELKNSRKRFMATDESGTMRRFSSNVMDKRGTTVMLFVASFAFLLLLGPFYVHWCITYLFYNYPQCHFTRNIYENVQVCMGVFNPYLTVIEKGMRECNHAVNFLLYMATSARFRSDFKRICQQIFYRIFGAAVLFLYKHICFCCTEPSCLVRLERHVSDSADLDTSLDTNRKKQAAYKTSHYHTNFERRRQNQMMKTNLLNKNMNTAATSLTSAASLNTLTPNSGKTVRTLTWNAYDRHQHPSESKRQAARLSQHFSTSSVF